MDNFFWNSSIETLVHHFLDELSRTYDRPSPMPDAELMSWLRSYRWPGNIRQLRNCVESMFVLADSSTLTMDELPEMICIGSQHHASRIDVPSDFSLEDVERAIVPFR